MDWLEALDAVVDCPPLALPAALLPNEGTLALLLPATRCLAVSHPAECVRCTAPPECAEEDDCELVGDPGKKNGAGEPPFPAAVGSPCADARGLRREDPPLLAHRHARVEQHQPARSRSRALRRAASAGATGHSFARKDQRRHAQGRHVGAGAPLGLQMRRMATAAAQEAQGDCHGT